MAKEGHRNMTETSRGNKQPSITFFNDGVNMATNLPHMEEINDLNKAHILNKWLLLQNNKWRHCILCNSGTEQQQLYHCESWNHPLTSLCTTGRNSCVNESFGIAERGNRKHHHRLRIWSCGSPCQRTNVGEEKLQDLGRDHCETLWGFEKAGKSHAPAHRSSSNKGKGSRKKAWISQGNNAVDMVAKKSGGFTMPLRRKDKDREEKDQKLEKEMNQRGLWKCRKKPCQKENINGNTKVPSELESSWKTDPGSVPEPMLLWQAHSVAHEKKTAWRHW